jgi:hypothetical protein
MHRLIGKNSEDNLKLLDGWRHSVLLRFVIG